MELFNLDELVTTQRTVRLFNTEYRVAERSVGQMLSAIKMAENAESVAPEVILQQMLDTAHQIIPDCPIEYIQRLNMKQIQALIKFASESDAQTEAAAENPQGK